MSKIKNPEIGRKPKPARFERRVRVTFFLVADREEHISAIEKIRDYLKAQYFVPQKGRELPVTGFTYSLFPSSPPYPSGEPGFAGLWWSTSKEGIKKIIIEKTVLFLIDFPGYAEEWKTDENIALLKTRIFEYYEAYQSPQDEIWIVKQDIYRHA